MESPYMSRLLLLFIPSIGCFLKMSAKFSTLAVTANNPTDPITCQVLIGHEASSSFLINLDHKAHTNKLHSVHVGQQNSIQSTWAYDIFLSSSNPRKSRPFFFSKNQLKMMKRRSTTTSSSSSSSSEAVKWEMRPGGMLVQKRVEKSDAPAPNLRVRVAYGAARYEISISSESTFGEVKKAAAAETGLPAAAQKVVFRGRERENGEYLGVCGVRDGSKVVVMEDPASIERRYVETRRNAKIQSAHRAISDVSMEVDRLAEQVSGMEESISNGVKVPEVQITTLIEMLMMQAIKLDTIVAEGDASTQKILQAKRVEKCVERLDVLKVANGRVKVAKPVVVTTKWETFDPHPSTTTRWNSLIDL